MNDLIPATIAQSRLNFAALQTNDPNRLLGSISRKAAAQFDTVCTLDAHGVATIDKDLMNVGRVIQLSWHKKILKLVLPSSLPLIFTGLRLSLGVGWMVLIAAEMLAQNPGLGKFVWDEFQNGSSSSLAKIMVAVLTIGVIGFVLDRLMLAFQAMSTYSATR